MRPEELDELIASLEYGKAMARLARCKNEAIRRNYQEVIDRYDKTHPHLRDRMQVIQQRLQRDGR